MKKIYQIIVLFIVFGFFSCTSVLDEVELDTPPKYTVSCFLAPESDTLQLYLTLSVPINKEIDFESNRTKVSKANILIINDKGEKITLEYDATKRIFFATQKSFKIDYGKKYDLEIKTVEGNTLTSSCIIPKIAPNFDIKIDSLNDKFYTTYEWQDYASETNYYRYIGEKRNPKFPTIGFDPNIYWTDGSQIATQIRSDESRDGQKLQSNRADLSEKENGFSSVFFGDVIDATLVHIDKNYYEFQRSIEKSKISNNFEPTPIFSNIEGGLGVFAGCSIKRKSQRIR